MEIAIAAWDAHGAIQYDGGGLRQDAIDTLEKLETNEAVTGGPTLDDMVPGLAKALAKALGWDRRASDMGEGRKSYARTDVRYRRATTRCWGCE